MKKTNWNNFRKNYRLLAHKGNPYISEVTFVDDQSKLRDLNMFRGDIRWKSN